jgi:hypothetical protein
MIRLELFQQKESLRMGFSHPLWRAMWCAAALMPATTRAQGANDEALQRRCWQSTVAERTAVDLRDPVAVSFSNVRDGYAVRSATVLCQQRRCSASSLAP